MIFSLDPNENEIFDKLSQKSTQTFEMYYKQLGATSITNEGDLRNAFGHAYSSAWLAYNIDVDTAKILGLIKEIATLNTEVKNHSLNGTDYNRGKNKAFKDGSRDMWNNELGIKYAQQAKQNKKPFKFVSKKIFDDIIANKMFIVDYEKNPVRWRNVTDFNSYKKELYNEAALLGIELSEKYFFLRGKFMFDLIYNSIQIKRKLDDKESVDDIKKNKSKIENQNTYYKSENLQQTLPPGLRRGETSSGKPYYTDGLSFFISQEALHEEIEYVFQNALEDLITRMGWERHDYS